MSRKWPDIPEDEMVSIRMKLPINYVKADRWKRKEAREQYVKDQKGRCYYCNCYLSGRPSRKVRKKSLNKLSFPKGFFDWPVHLHHSHVTHMTIGAVHNYCNAVLWEYHQE
jgi:hypothetical protein